MPQIANQDYNLIRPVFASSIFSDEQALGEIAGHLMRGTIWDCIIDKPIYDDDGPARVIAVTPNNDGIFVYIPQDEIIQRIDVEYTPTQYSGLATVQVLLDLTSSKPALDIDSNDYLKETETGYYLCVDNKFVSIETDDSGYMASFTVTGQSPSDDMEWVNITYEDLQKLLGVLIG